jgi:hypothetical protein
LGFSRRLDLPNGAFELLQLFGNRGIRQPGCMDPSWLRNAWGARS